jgi:hypothetical protein
MEFQITSGITRYFDIKLDNSDIAQSKSLLFSERVLYHFSRQLYCLPRLDCQHYANQGQRIGKL